MNHKEFLESEELKIFLNETTKNDWLFSDERGIYTFKNDLNLGIKRKDIVFDH